MRGSQNWHLFRQFWWGAFLIWLSLLIVAFDLAFDLAFDFYLVPHLGE